MGLAMAERNNGHLRKGARSPLTTATEKRRKKKRHGHFRPDYKKKKEKPSV